MTNYRSPLVCALLVNAAANKLGVRRFQQNNFGIWTFLSQHPANACHCTASAIACDHIIQPLAIEIRHYLPGRGILVNI